MKQSFTPEEVDEIENNSYEIGIIVGRTTERARIVDLLKNKQLEITLPDGTAHIEHNVLHDIIDHIEDGK